jgi:DNA (cytosine-5)-methyltransferase 1
MKHISLFSGIGGFDLAAEWAEWTNVASCEINDFGNKVLEYYWPKAYHHRDIHTLTGQILNDEIQQRFGADWKADGTILTGGFPCQPYSTAGKRLGKEDERHLWPEMLRVIREVQPEWIVGENVRGLVSWSGGLVFEEVWAGLETIGYEVQPFILPAASVNAPHKRERIWFVAYSNSRRLERAETERWNRKYAERSSSINASNANDARLERREKQRSTPSSGPNQHKQSSRFLRSIWEDFPAESAVCSRNDGISERLDSITFPKWRNESIKAAGNAIVPQVAYQIFKAINEYRSI